MPLVVHQGIPSSLFILGVCVCARASMHSCMPGCWEKHRIKKDGLGNGEVWEEAGKLRKGLLSCQQSQAPWIRHKAREPDTPACPGLV